MKYIITAALLVSSLLGVAQNHKVEGTLVGENNDPLAYATVVFLQAKDSVMSQFGITDESGNFVVKGLKQGDYIAQFAFLGYQNFSKNITLTEDVNMGSVKMEEENVKLNEVEIEAEMIPVKIKGDTIQYNADAFTTQPHAVVEDLLKQLPGVEVDKDGSVTAQGEQVTKVLVDGKEFFGNDPKIATKNLPADAIDKVEVFDKQSDMAEFTGVDDGDRIKTINLLLKEGKKAGYFGNATGGYGYPDNRFEGKFNINQFTKKTQLSILGMGNNINDQGFSIDDYSNFMGGFRNMMQAGLVSFDGGRPTVNMNTTLSNGITTAFAGGLNLNYDIDKDTELNTSYFYNRIQNEMLSSTSRKYFNNRNNFDSEETGDEETLNNNHKLNYRLRHKIDSIQDLQLRGSVTYNDGNTALLGTLQNMDGNSRLANASNTQNLGDGTGMDISTTLIYRRKFAKAGRSFVINGNLDLGDEDRVTNLNSNNTYYTYDSLGNVTFRFDSVMQNQDYIDNSQRFGGKVSYTEPLGKGHYLEVNYSHQETHTELIKDFYDQDPAIQAEIFNDQLSSDYLNTYLYDRGGVNYKISRDKYNLTLGASLQQSKLDGEIRSANTTVKKTFTNILPNLRYDYRFTNTKRLRFSYNARMNEPSIQQLQPVVDNSNPLQVYVGNPDLKPEYTHSGTMRLMSFSQFTFTSFFVMLRGTYTQDKITNAVTIDSLFVQTSQPVNVDDDLSLTVYTGFDTPIRPLKIKFSASPRLTYRRSILFVSGVENNTDNYITGFNTSIGNRKKEKVDVEVGASWSHNLTKYSENEALDQEFLTSNYFVDFLVNFMKSWSVSTSLDYTIYSGDAFANDETIPILKGSLSKFFLNNRGKLKFTVFDVLDENRGFSRTSNLNYVEELNTNTIGRYYMLTFSYSLRGFGKQNGSWFSKMIGGRRK